MSAILDKIGVGQVIAPKPMVVPGQQSAPIDRYIPLMSAIGSAMSVPSERGTFPILGTGILGFAQGRHAQMAQQNELLQQMAQAEAQKQRWASTQEKWKAQAEARQLNAEEDARRDAERLAAVQRPRATTGKGPGERDLDRARADFDAAVSDLKAAHKAATYDDLTKTYRTPYAPWLGGDEGSSFVEQVIQARGLLPMFAERLRRYKGKSKKGGGAGGAAPNVKDQLLNDYLPTN